MNEIIAKIKIALGAYEIDVNEEERLVFHINAAYKFFTVIKGISKDVIESDIGIQLLSIYVNDVWRESGCFDFSPATEILFNTLMDETIGLEHANNIIN